MADLWRVTYMGDDVKPTEVGAFSRYVTAFVDEKFARSLAGQPNWVIVGPGGKEPAEAPAPARKADKAPEPKHDKADKAPEPKHDKADKAPEPKHDKADKAPEPKAHETKAAAEKPEAEKPEAKKPETPGKKDK